MDALVEELGQDTRSWRSRGMLGLLDYAAEGGKA